MAYLLKFLFAAATVILVLSSTKPSLTSRSSWNICKGPSSLFCKCSSDIMSDVTASCQFHHVTELKTIISDSRELLRLNLSWNKIQDIPQNSFQTYSSLIYLSLSSNKIHTISQGAFSGLETLRELNLHDNLIKQWDTTLIEQDLPNLTMLNVAQNIYWKPDQQVLSLPNLKVMYLLWGEKPSYSSWLPFKCYIIKRNGEARENYSFVETFPSRMEDEVTPNALLARSGHCWRSKVYFRDASYWDVISKNGFYFHCAHVQSYQNSMNSTFALSERQQPWYYIKNAMIPYCWNTMQRIHIITLIEGICAMVFNLIVIITTLRSRVLRESVAHVLVANIAVGDLMMSLYMIIVTSTRQSMSAENYYSITRPYYCKIVGLFFLMGQFSSAFMSLIMTLERYLAVVYCMRPHIRITRRMTYVAIAIVWGLALSLAASFMTSPQFSLHTDNMCIPVSNIDKQPVIHYVGVTGIISYFVAMALYGHLYLSFKKTNQKTVQLQRENRLARRIALIMFTNVFFFILPLIITFIVENIKDNRLLLSRFIFTKTFSIIFLGINSCLNPILFSFRNELFRNELRRNILGGAGASVAAQP